MPVSVSAAGGNADIVVHEATLEDEQWILARHMDIPQPAARGVSPRRRRRKPSIDAHVVAAPLAKFHP